MTYNTYVVQCTYSVAKVIVEELSLLKNHYNASWVHYPGQQAPAPPPKSVPAKPVDSLSLYWIFYKVRKPEQPTKLNSKGTSEKIMRLCFGAGSLLVFV